MSQAAVPLERRRGLHRRALWLEYFTVGWNFLEAVVAIGAGVIAGSTERAARLGDRRWRELLEVHDDLARRLVEQFGGQLVKTTGDGILATFDGPGRAIRCAAALRDELTGIDLRIRAGLHAGEIELRDGDVGGIAVHIAARVMATAAPDEILTSSTVRDLVVGSDIAMTDRGPHPLKGVDGTWQLFAASP